jgi:hypothetical protein
MRAERDRHRPRRFTGRHHVNSAIFEGIERPAGGGDTEEMTGIDRVHTRTKDLVQVGAKPGERNVQ